MSRHRLPGHSAHRLTSQRVTWLQSRLRSWTVTLAIVGVLAGGLSVLTAVAEPAAATVAASAGVGVARPAAVAAAPRPAGCIGPDVACDVAGAAADLAKGGVDAVVGAATGSGDAPEAAAVAGGAAAAAGGVARGVAGGVAGGIAGGFPNPFDAVGGIVAKGAADAWTAAMLGLWAAGLWVLKLVLAFADFFLTPDLRGSGPGGEVYQYTFWLAAALMLIMAMVQLGIAALRRDGKSLAQTAIGTAQFMVVWGAWLGYCVAVVAACGGLTRAMMNALLKVNTWSEWDPLGGFGLDDVTDGVVATVLGLLGCVLFLAAIGHLLVLLARAASLMVLVSTGPIAAAGLVGDAGRPWFWKTLRWFHAAALTPPLMVLVLGVGVQMSTGVAAGLTDTTQQAVGTALPSVLLIAVGCVAPLALFKLLAFVDPGTPSGASFRQGMALQGGLQGLLSGKQGGSQQGSSAASSTDQHGRSSGESGAESSTSDRFGKSTQGALGSLGGSLGGALATGMGVVAKVGAMGASLISDETNQAGVGHQTYAPDFSGLRSGPGSSQGAGKRKGSGGGDGSADGSGDGSGSTGSGPEDDAAAAPQFPPPPVSFPPHSPPPPPSPPSSPTAGSAGGGPAGAGAGAGGAGGGAGGGDGGGAGGGDGGGAGGGAGGAGAAGAVPPVPV